MTLAVCAAFAAPCLNILDAEGGAFNIYGPSSHGKSLSLKLAASVFGKGKEGGTGKAAGYVHSWQATLAGREQLFVGHADLPLILDEAGQCPPKQRGATIYALAGGSGMTRGGLDKYNRVTKRETPGWRLLLLSSAEMTAESWLKADRAGMQAYAGQLARFTDVYACPVSTDLGVFEKLPEGMSGAETAHAIEQAAVECYGTAGRQWLEYLTKHREVAREALTAHMQAFSERFDASLRKGQYARVLKRFALCAAAGELATSLGLTGWDVPEFGEGFAAEQVYACARDALKPFGIGHEYSAGVKQLIEKCTTESAHFKELPWGREPLTPCYGSRWWANPDGTLCKDNELGPTRESSNTEDKEDKDCTACSRDDTAFFFHQELFEKGLTLGEGDTVKAFANWLYEKGALVRLGGDSSRNGCLSRLGKKYGLPGKKTPGYVVLLERLYALNDEL